MGIGRRIRAIRGSRSQQEFAPILGITQDRLSKYELGRVAPSLSLLIRVAESSGKSLDWLILGVRGRGTAAVEPKLQEILREVREVWREGNPDKRRILVLLLQELRLRP